MKKLFAILLSLLMVTAFAAGCGPADNEGNNGNNGNNGNSGNSGQQQGDPNKPDDKKPAPRELLFDRNFEAGVRVSALESLKVSYTWWKYQGRSDASREPYWMLGQYCNLANTRKDYDSSVNDLSLGTMFEEGTGIEKQEDGKEVLTNKSGSKLIQVDTKTGEVTLNVDTSKEYINQETGAIVPRSGGEDWVHMILSQQCGVVYFSEAESFRMSLDFTLNECTVFDETGGADQFQWIFTVHDKTSTIGDYFWFNVCLFDNRYEIFPGAQQYDGGKEDATGKFIYAPTGEQLFGETGGKVEQGREYHVELDLIKYMKEAFDTAQSMGAMQGCEWKNCAINGFNIGWEVTNVSRASVSIRNMSLSVTDKT